jgi:4-alpha-glucanotransferase
MKLTFRIHYYTQWGQQIAVLGSLPQLGDHELDKAFILTYQGEGYWEGTVQIPDEDIKNFTYRYLLIDSTSGMITEEWGTNRLVELHDQTPDIWFYDAWHAQNDEHNVFYRSAFVEAITRPDHFPKPKPVALNPEEVSVQFQMEAPAVPAGYQLAIIGNIEELGNWSQAQPLLLHNANFPRWEGKIQFPKYRVGYLEYKYCFYDPATDRIAAIERGGNRRLEMGTLFDKHQVIVSDQNFRHPDGPWKGAGLAIPVFSIRTEESMGVGSFTDLKKMVDWAVKCGMKMVQILPVNDTIATRTWTDSYPYAAISVFALHPIYLHLDDLFDLLPEGLAAAKKSLNQLSEVDYEQVLEKKLNFARLAFAAQRDTFIKSKDFKTYFKENRDWLEPYAAFSYLRDQYRTVDFRQWGKDAVFSTERLQELIHPKSKAYPEILFYYFLQYHLDAQLRSAAGYARSRGVVLKGDLPIGIYRHSVDAWVAPDLYNMDGQSGAPPDPFSDDGQNWGFPTYNWPEMAKDGYQWWKKRMQQLARYFDVYRIDHILGFFRIWEIPTSEVDGLLGVFNPAIPVSRQELEQKGIAFNEQRLCEPYITNSILRQTFGHDAEFVLDQFFESAPDGTFRFKTNFNTQEKIQAYFAEAKLEKSKASLEDKLFKLRANVLFLRDKKQPKTHFHPRIDLIHTSSFSALAPDQQVVIRDVYYDYFYHRQEEFWRERAMEKLPALREATNMLICGEDLGMVPDCVPGVMGELNILSLEIQRMSKNPATEFLDEKDIPYLSVASPSTHDMSPIRLWWEETDWDKIQRFYEQELKMVGDHPFYCEPYIAQAIVNQHLNWPSMWTVFPVQDLLAMDGRLRREDPTEERINVPANSKHYWRYRMHLSVEQLIEENGFNQMLYAMLSSTNRV